MVKRLHYCLMMLLMAMSSSVFAQVEVGKNLNFAEGTPAVVGVCTYAKDTANNKTSLSQMQEVPEWVIAENGDARAGGVFTYGSNVWLGGTGYNVPATNSKGEATGNALGIVGVWSGKAQYTQKVTLAAGCYELTVPVYNAKGGTSAPTKSLIGFITDEGVEYLASAKSYAVDTWTVDTVRFLLEEETTGVLSLGYQAPNAGSGSNQHWFVDYVAINTIPETVLLVPALANAVVVAEAVVEAKANVGDAAFMIPTTSLDAYAAAVAAAKTVADKTDATAEELKTAISDLEAATAAYYTSAVAPKYATITQKASGFNLAIVDSGIKIITGSVLQFEAAPTGGWYITDGSYYVNYKGTDAWSMVATDAKADTWTIAANAEGLYTIKGKNGSIGTDNTTAGSSCYGNKSGDKALWTIVAVEDIMGMPENGETVATDLTEISFMFNDAKFAKINSENNEPVNIIAADGVSVALTGATMTAMDGLANAFDLTNLVEGVASPIFSAEGTYTVEIPAGKFLLGADEATATTPSNRILLTYNVIAKKLILTPADSSTVETLESIELNFQGYDYMDADFNADWSSSPRNIIIKKDTTVVKESAFDSWGEIESVNYQNIMRLNLGLTEAGTYTIEIPAGKFCDFGGESPYPATTLTYTVLGLENVTVDPKDSKTVATDLEKILIVIDDAAYAKVNAENAEPVLLIDADGKSVELTGAKFVHLGENGYYLTNEVEGVAAPIFSAEGTYTIKVPAGKFLLGADESTATTPSKAFKFAYTVVEKKVLVNPVDSSTVPVLESLELTFQGYNTMYIDDELVGMVVEEAKPITVKKGDEIVKTITSASFSHDVQNVIVLNELGLTEPATYTLEFPAGKFTDMKSDFAAFTLTYNVVGYEDVTANPMSGDTVMTDLKSIAVTFNETTVVALNEECYDPVFIYDENGESAGSIRGLQAEIVGNVATLKNVGWSGEMAIFQSAGTYTLEFPAGKFYIGEDSVASKSFKLNYVVEPAPVVVNLITNPEDGATVETLEKVHIVFDGYEVAEPDWNTSATNIVVKKGDDVYKEFTGLKDEISAESDYGWNEWDLNLGLTEAGTYTITIPAGKFWDPMNMISFPEITLTYTLTGAVNAVPANLDFAEGTPAVVGVCTYAKDTAANATVLSQLQEVPAWTIAENGDARAGGIFTYGSNVWNGGAGYNVPATDSKGEATGNALGIVAVWGATAQYTQNITLEAGNYVITVPVYNVKGGTAAPVKNLIGFIAEDSTEYLAPAKTYTVDAWTVETVSFTLAEKTSGVLSLGYQAPNSGSGANQHWFIDYVAIKAVSDAELAKTGLISAIAAANATIAAKANVGDGLFMIPTSAVDTYAAAVAEAQKVVDNAEATIEQVKTAVETLATATAAYAATPVNVPVAGTSYAIKQNASGFNLAIVDGAVKIAEDAALQFEAAENGGWYITDGTSYINYAGTDKWTMTATAEKTTVWTIAANAEGLYTIKGQNGGLGTDGVEVGSSVFGDKNNDKSLWTIEKAIVYAEITTYPENGETFTLGEYEELSLWFSSYPTGKLNTENTDPVMITDAAGTSVALEGVKFVEFNEISKGFAYQLVKEDGSSLFSEVGTYTIEIPAGKFITTDSASVTNPYKKIKVTYTIEAPLAKEIIVDPVDGSKVDALESITITYQGYDGLTTDVNGDMNMEVRNIVIKKDGVVVKEAAFDGWDEIEELNFSNEFKINLGITEAGVYTIEIPDGKFCEWFGDGAPGVTLTYTVGDVTGINGIAAEDIVKTEYISVNGAVLATPAKGVNIVKYTLVDGTVVTAKIYVK